MSNADFVLVQVNAGIWKVGICSAINFRSDNKKLALEYAAELSQQKNVGVAIFDELGVGSILTVSRIVDLAQEEAIS